MAALDVVAPESRRGIIPVNRTNRAGVALTWRPPSGLGIGRFLIQVGEELLDHLGILETRDDPYRTAAGRAGLDVDAEDPLQALCRSHRSAAFGRRQISFVIEHGRPVM